MSVVGSSIIDLASVARGKLVVVNCHEASSIFLSSVECISCLLLDIAICFIFCHSSVAFKQTKAKVTNSIKVARAS